MFYAQELNNNSKNLKKTWSILIEVLRKSKNKQKISSINNNGYLITDPTIIANNFNTFFTTIADEIAGLINPARNFNSNSDNVTEPNCNVADDDPEFPNPFNLTNIQLTDGEIISSIESIEDKKTPDMSDFSTSLLKKIFLSIITPIRHIFHHSLHTGILPSKLKIAKVIPIFKSGDTNDVNNYRPISLLSTFSKILEKIVQTRLISYLDASKLITPQQFGFRSHHSTIHPMSLLLKKVTCALNEKSTQ
jgi:hypothetical protein